LMLLNQEGSKPAVVFCRLNDSIAIVVKMLTYYHVHRVFIVDADSKPIGIISIHDVLKALVSV